MRLKLFFGEIAQEGDFPVRIRPRDIGLSGLYSLA
jgi:hypothetical protein